MTKTFALDPSDPPRSILDQLNPAQRAAAEQVEGPVMIIAGAGSGKTRTLTYRIAHLVGELGIAPWQVLALTFTNKAAKEMKARIATLIGEPQADKLWMGTFHSVFARILRVEAEQIGYAKNFSILDSEDQVKLIRLVMDGLGISTQTFSPVAIHHRISGAKNQLIFPAEYARLAADVMEEKTAQVYAAYQARLRQSNAMDFDDLILKPIDLFTGSPETLAKYQTRFRYLLVDEYQDTNRAQYAIVKLLAAKSRNLCIVGDDAQSIYAFRGADIGNILAFEKDYPEAKTFRLEQNYRSTARILKAADSIIKLNKDQISKNLWTDNPEGDYVTLVEADSERDEGERIARKAKSLHLQGGYSWREFAVLYRTNAQSRAIEDALRREGIPYHLVGGTSFYKRREIKDVIAYLKLTVNPRDDEAFMRVINLPTRGLGDTSLLKVQQYAALRNLSLMDALERLGEIDSLGARQKTTLTKFYRMIAEHREQAEQQPAGTVARSLVEATGMLKALKDENTAEANNRWDNIQELLNGLQEYTDTRADPTTGESPSLSQFLEEVSLVSDIDSLDQSKSNVTLMTLHAAKGLEFPIVFIAGLEEKLFPLEKASQDRKELEEERRLLYVGITRAERKLFLSHAKSRYRYGQQEYGVKSRFLDEIDPTVLVNEAGRFLEPPARKRFALGAYGYDDGGAYGSTDPHYWRADGPPKKVAARRAAPPKPQKGERTVELDPEYATPTPDLAPTGRVALAPGMKVRHEQFGDGRVLRVDGKGDSAMATVFFPAVGQKNLMLKFAKLLILG